MIPNFERSQTTVYDDLFLYEDVEQLYIAPNGHNELLVIDRLTAKTEVQERKSQLDGIRPTQRVCGVLGLIKLIGGQYLILASHRLFVGMINGQSVWKLAGTALQPLQKQQTVTSHLTAKQKEQNDIYLAMLQKVLDTPFFYYSYSYDLSYTLQKLHSMPEHFEQLGLAERGDPRMMWNSYLLNNFKCANMQRFALGITHGFVSINPTMINGVPFTWTIISRRSVQRAGTRLFIRGADESGNVANFVETEQIVECNGQFYSFVQTRGSMPFFWHQTPNLKYKPPPELVSGKDHFQACSKHFEGQLAYYGQNININLVDQKGAEGQLETRYKQLVQQLNNALVRYEAFDFHKECKQMKYDRANILVDRLIPDLESMSDYHKNAEGQLLSRQTGVFRTNCIDCLDRTNVIQSMLARRSLNKALVKLAVLRSGQSVETSAPDFEKVFKGVWADNADMISIQYSGTGALKTDYTRTGKRSKAGLLKDGANSLVRYVKNNFNDGFRQDAIDLFLGTYTVKDNEGSAIIPSPLEKIKTWRYGTFPSVLLLAIAMFFASALFPSEYSTESFLFIMFWGSMIGLTAAGIFRYGVEFVDWPKLNPLKRDFHQTI